ncbi:hypothetical protein D3C86_2149530 [compost metagenome]
MLLRQVPIKKSTVLPPAQSDWKNNALLLSFMRPHKEGSSCNAGNEEIAPARVVVNAAAAFANVSMRSALALSSPAAVPSFNRS